MNKQLKAMVVVGLTGMACLSVAAGPESTAIDDATRWEEVTYTVLPFPASIFACGCTGSGGGWPPCPACPMHFATEFTGTMSLTPRFPVPQGARIYDVVIEDWLVTFYGDDQPTEVTGEGTYGRWSRTDGTSWQSMTLDLWIGDEEVHMLSGVVEHPNTGGGMYPDILISLESDTECWGYWLLLNAEHVRPPVLAEHPAEAITLSR